MSAGMGSTVTSAFIDLATYDEIEKYMYGGADATAYFVRETRKSTWFSQVPVVLSKASGSPGFDSEWSVQISRAGDYLLYTWLRLTLAQVAVNTTYDNGAGRTFANTQVRWTRNVMHNLIRECALAFNDLVAARFDNYHLDFWAAFTTPAGKQNGYNNMIGNIAPLTQGAIVGSQTLPAATLNLPLPFFYSRDSGVALPTAALPYNEMRINFSFRPWTDLLIAEQFGPLAPAGEKRFNITVGSATTDLLLTEPTMSNVNVWANYAIVSNDERKRMACAPRDILIEQVQTAPRQNFNPSTNQQPQYDIRFSHAIKVFFFSVRNRTWNSEWSNYTTNSPFPNIAGGGVNFNPPTTADPILQTSLIYENTNRLSQMGSDYFSLINPYYHSPVIANQTGYHTYSYSLDYMGLDPMGSTNYGKLTNVSITPEASAQAVIASNGAGARGTGANFVQLFEFDMTAVNNNIIRISGGALGFPVL